MTENLSIQELRMMISQLGEEKFRWMQIARDYKLRSMRSEARLDQIRQWIDIAMQEPIGPECEALLKKALNRKED